MSGTYCQKALRWSATPVARNARAGTPHGSRSQSRHVIRDSAVSMSRLSAVAASSLSRA
jgi:hypothetical protein